MNRCRTKPKVGVQIANTCGECGAPMQMKNPHCYCVNKECSLYEKAFIFIPQIEIAAGETVYGGFSHRRGSWLKINSMTVQTPSLLLAEIACLQMNCEEWFQNDNHPCGRHHWRPVIINQDGLPVDTWTKNVIVPTIYHPKKVGFRGVISRWLGN